MAGNRTFAIVKPMAVRNNNIGNILSIINQVGFRIRAMRMVRMSKEEAGRFYEAHRGKPFYENLTDFMSSTPTVAMIIEKENAVEDFRQLIGATDPDKAEDGTIRKLFGISLTANAIHGSDCDENAEREAKFFFSPDQIFEY
ncbi:MAG: nucleoside-diphosphate kinase [Bacteroidales bacterium]|nr:nucleoside-diphosphate kinase [Bacteroidales bacterium]